MFGLQRRQKSGRYARDYEEVINAYKEHIKVLQQALQDKELHLLLTTEQIGQLADEIVDQLEEAEAE